MYASNISAMMIDTKVMVVLIKYTLNISSVLTIQNDLYTVYLIEYTLNNHTKWNAMHRSLSANVAHLSFDKSFLGEILPGNAAY